MWLGLETVVVGLRPLFVWIDECAARLQPPGRSIKTPKNTRFDRYNPIMFWGQTNLFLLKIFV